MRLNAEEWIRPRRPRESFPPYELADRPYEPGASSHAELLDRLPHIAFVHDS